MNADKGYAAWRRSIGKQCQANTSMNTLQARFRVWHICQKPVGHGKLHECFCGQLFDDLGEHFTWENVRLATVWSVRETNGTI